MPLVQDPAGTGGTEKKQLPGVHSLWFAACSCCIFFDGLGLGLCVCQVSLSALSTPQGLAVSHESIHCGSLPVLVAFF